MRPEIRQGLIRYAAYGTRPGHFLCSVLANDLFKAVGYGDPGNLGDLKEIVLFINNELPGSCHGSAEKLEEWIKRRGIGGDMEGSGKLLDAVRENLLPDLQRQPEDAIALAVDDMDAITLAAQLANPPTPIIPAELEER